MTRETDDAVDDIDVPQDLVRQLNDLGFALLDRGTVYAFARSAIDSEIHLTVEPLGQDTWRVGVKWRRPTEPDRMPNPLVPMPLGRLGQSVDGVTIELSTSELLADLARLMGDAVLPLVDLAPS